MIIPNLGFILLFVDNPQKSGFFIGIFWELIQ